MEKDKYKYIAFISYRHNELDKFVAENLHRLIETYKMPIPVVEKYHITDNNYRRVFRDQEELPLSSNLEDPIVEALKESNFLIVICSPRLKESKWCKKEIESFIKIHGRNKILCVLVEGEPDESFPEILKYREEKVVTKTGKERTKKVPCEPLAMDIRGKDKKEILANLKKELIRAIAPMYNLDYDDIKRRHEERELKRKANIFKIVAIASFIFAIYSFMLFSKIFVSNKQLKYDQSISLSNESHELLSKDNRNKAILKAYQSVTEYNNNSMPITANGIYELTDSLGVYYSKSLYKATSQLDTLGVVYGIWTDITQSYLLSYDQSEELILWDLATESKIKTVNDTIFVADYFGGSVTFVGKDRYAYINRDYYTVILDLKGNEITKIKTPFIPIYLSASVNGKYIAINDGNQIAIYEMDKYTEVGSYKVSSDMTIGNTVYFDNKEENIVFSTQKKGISLYNASLSLMTYSINKKTVINRCDINAYEVKRIMFHNDDIIVLSTIYKSGGKFDSLLTHYKYQTGKENYKHRYSNSYMETFEMSFLDNGEGQILLADEKGAYLIDYKTGKLVKNYALTTGGLFIQSLPGIEGFWLFEQDGGVTMIDGKEGVAYSPSFTESIFIFKEPQYEKIIRTKIGFLALTKENRIIIYDHIDNPDIKEIEYEAKDFPETKSEDRKEIIKEYNFNNKSMVNKVFYSNDKSLLFVTYYDNKLEVYDNSQKRLLNSILMPIVIERLDTYLGQTKDGWHVIKDNKGVIGSEGGYILDNNFEIVAYVPDLYDYQDGKVIIKKSNKYYEVKIYSKDEIIAKGKEYLELKKLA